MRPRATLLNLVMATGALAVCLCSCRKPLQPATENPPAVDGRDAYFMASAATAFGPRPAGSIANFRQLEWIAAEARTAGASKVKLMEFKENTPDGPVKFRNVVIDVKGASDRFVIVAAHHDTKKLASFPDFVGANDGGSGVGLALQMMKSICLSKSVPPHSVKFVFFDGEECFLEYSATDGLYGSRKLAKQWADSGMLKKCDGIMLLDMVGDADLKITFPADSDKELVDIAMDAAKEAGLSNYFAMHEANVLDDHKPFQDKGVPAIDFIDFSYGPENRYWHTSADTIDKLAGESFTIVGKVAMELLWKVPFRD